MLYEVITNFYTGRRSGIAHLLSHPRFEVLRHDICFPLYVEVDEIYNLACPASPVHYQFDPVQTTKTSVITSYSIHYTKLYDPGLAFHPPFLYLGYVGLSTAFSFAVAALIEGRVDAAWARWVRPWTLAAWIFLTIGISYNFV